jgi:hypothetical protein
MVEIATETQSKEQVIITIVGALEIGHDNAFLKWIAEVIVP